jgi:tetratricopeptide (TPR) repeat protein
MNIRALFLSIVLLHGLTGSLVNARVVRESNNEQTIPGQQQPESTPAGEPKKSENAENPSDVTKQTYSKEAFVVEELRERYRFENDGTGSKVATLRVHILSEAGVVGFGQLRFGYNAANDRMEIGYVRVTKPDGNVVTAGADAIQDLSGMVQQAVPVYTDYREKHITVPGLRPGDVLECEVTTNIRTALAPGQFWMQHDFNQSSIVLHEQLEIGIPAGRTVKLKSKKGMEPKITEENGRRTYLWTSSHLARDDDSKATDKDKKKKVKTDQVSDVQLTTFGSWEEVGRWYAGLEKERRVPSKEVRAKADALTKGLTSDLDKTEALYDFVAKNFRYVSLSLGLARYQPQAAADVLRNQYGDCKDKNTLLAALLEAENLHSSTVLIKSLRKLDPDVPSPSQFNHVITELTLGKEEVWMDTTTEVAPFRLLSYQLRQKQGLVIPETGVPHLEETPSDPFVADRSLTDITGKIDDSGKLEATVSYTLRGDTELRQRMMFRRMASAQWQKYIEGWNKTLGGEVRNVQVGDPVATRDPFTISYHVSKANYVDWSKKKLALKLPLAHLGIANVSADVDEESEDEEVDASATENFKLGPPNEQTYHLKLELTARYTVVTPVPTALDRDYGAYQSTYKLEGGVFTAERKLTIKKGELPPARADDYRAFRRAALADAGQALTIESTLADSHSIPSGMKAQDLVKSGNEARKNGNYTLAIDLFNRAIEAEPKSKVAWNDLGIVYMNDHRDELAINAFQKQIDINPYHGNAYDNLGRVYLRERKYENAEKWFRKQLEIQPLHQHALTNLGVAYLETHNYQDAVPQLEKAASLAPDDANAQVRLGEAYLYLGQDDKAMTAFDKAVKISATPLIWNDIAYHLACKNAHLEVARRYAESAVSATSASLRNVLPDQLKQRDLGLAASLANYWDTLGWVAFSEGRLDVAEKYVSAAWQLGAQGAEGDHLGQIYEKLGKKSDAQHVYALALNARRPELETRGRLTALVGGDDKVDAVVEKYRNELRQERSIRVPNTGGLAGKADFFILLSPGKGSENTVEGVAFVDGDGKLKPLTAAIQNAKFNQNFPDETPVKVLRRGTLSCKADSDCGLELALPDDVRSVE